MNIRSLVKQFLTLQQNKRYERIYLDKKVTYEQWILQEERSGSADRREWREADKKPLFFYVFVGGDGTLAENALEEIACYFMEHPQVMLLYADEDIWTAGKEERTNPWFKPDWSPDTFESFYYFGNMTAVRGELAEQAGVEKKLTGIDKRQRKEQGKEQRKEQRKEQDNMPWVTVDIASYPDWQQWKTIVEKLIVQAGGFQRGSTGIGHIARMLFHAGSIQAQEQYFAWSQEVGKPEGKDMLSVIIPSKDNPKILEKALRSLMNSVEKVSSEVIIVDNGSTVNNKKKIRKLINELTNFIKISYVYHPMPFHFSRMCNMGAEKAKGKLLLFLNDDVEMVNAGWMEKMLLKAEKEYTGAVGLKLYYPDSIKIQHAGITNLPMGPVHKLQFHQDNRSYYYGRNYFDSNVLAVTGACLMVREDKFRQTGGFSEELPVAFNDVDLCFSLYELGYSNVVVNSAWAFHHESLSRGEDDSPEKMDRLLGERDKLYERHLSLREKDPYYPHGLGRNVLDTAMRPEYFTSGNKMQSADMVEIAANSIDHYRRDRCLMVGIEYCGQDKIYGYGVVLGDNNACYSKKLILGKTENMVFTQLWSQELTQQYRPDLEENMPDQCRVALSGFWLDLSGQKLEGKYGQKLEEKSGQKLEGKYGQKLEEKSGQKLKGKYGQKLPKGIYQVGMTACSRVGDLKLINWSNRFLHIK